MAKKEDGLEFFQAELEKVISELGNSVAQGLVKGLEESKLIHQLLELMQQLQDRVDEIESRLDARSRPWTEPSLEGPVSLPDSDEDVQEEDLAPGNNHPAGDDESNEGTGTCKEPGCDRPSRSRGLCSLHYQRLRYQEKKAERDHKPDSPQRAEAPKQAEPPRQAEAPRQVEPPRQAEAPRQAEPPRQVEAPSRGTLPPSAPLPPRVTPGPVPSSPAPFQRPPLSPLPPPKTAFGIPLGSVPPPPPPALRPRYGGRNSSSHTPPTTTIRREGGTKGVFALLYEDRGRKVMASLINQIKINRSELPERVNAMYQGMPGTPLEEEDVMRVIHYHNLGESLRKREADVISRNLLKQRGSLVKTAQKLKTEVEPLKAKITELGLDDEVQKIRTKFKEEVLHQSSFNERLELALTREKYLSDLEIEKEIDDSLRRELDAQLAQWTTGPISEEGAKAVREALSLDEEKFRRLLKRFGVEASFPIDQETTPPTEGEGSGPAEG